MLGIYTRSNSILSKEFWKWAARRLTHKYSGPNAVEDSLLRGLKKLRVPYIRHSYRNVDTAIVLSGVEALKHAIKTKKAGKLKKLIAGPNIVTHPSEFSQLICDPAVDVILVPSEWVANFWIREAPQIASKVQIWPAGVAEAAPSTRSGLPIVYNKLGNDGLLPHHIGDYRLFRYGDFNHDAYLAALKDAPYLVYLSQSESQGLALQEAWAHDVPTLVNKSTRWQKGPLAFEAPQINCPYLTPEVGAIFADPLEIPIMIEQMKTLRPKQYCDEYLSDRASAERLLKLL